MAGLTQQKLQGEDNPRWRHDQKKKNVSAVSLERFAEACSTTDWFIATPFWKRVNHNEDGCFSNPSFCTYHCLPVDLYMLMGSGKQLQKHWSLKPVVAGCCFGTGQTNPFPLILNTAFRNYGLVGNFHIPLGPFMGCLIWTGDGIISMISQGWT